MQSRMAHASFIHDAPWVSFYNMDDDGENFNNKLRGMEQYGIEMIHIHNEPSWLARAVRRIHPDMPIIFDAHDMNLSRGFGSTEGEIEAFQICDGYLFPSQTMMDTAIEAVPRVAKKPHGITHSMVIQAHHPPIPSLFPRIGGLVYQGGLATGGDEDYTPFDYRDWRQAVIDLTELGIPIHLFGATLEDIGEVYGRFGAVCYPQQEYMALMQALNRYDWNLVGAPIDSKAIQACMPNKLFEGIAAGIPSIVLNASEAAEFVREHQLGVVIDSLDEIPGIYHEHEKYRKIVEAKRHMFTMESQLPVLERVYKEVYERHVARKGR
jgi:hypothetical protein